MKCAYIMRLYITIFLNFATFTLNSIINERDNRMDYNILLGNMELYRTRN